MIKECGWLVGVACLALACGAAPAQQPASLTLQQAHEAALKNHPRISVAQLTALATGQVARQARAGYYPQVSANVLAVGTADNNTRLSAIGALNNPAIYDREAQGVMVSQLITDFGRTLNLSRSAELRARAAENATEATREQVLLAVDAAFLNALEAQAVTRVAQQTVTNRQLLLDQVGAAARNNLRPELDVSFAKVNFEEAQLILSRAQNDLQAGFVRLDNLMGLTESTNYQLVEQPMPADPSTNVAEYVQQALSHRPDVLSLRNEQGAAAKFARAERALRYPTLAAVGAAGLSPIRDSQLRDNFAAAGVILSFPLYTGGLYAARQREAELRAQAAAETLRDLENNVIRDVRIAWLNAQNARDRLPITRRLLDNARLALELAQARYKNSISSIVELNQAELTQISAEIAYASTQYEYLLQRSALSFQIGALQ